MNAANLDDMEQAKRTLIDLSIRYGPRLFSAGIILAVGLVVARRVGNFATRWLGRRELDPPVRQLISRLLSLVVLLLFGMLALQNLGIELLPLLASLGVAGLGIGLAMQGVLSNVVAGLTIIFTRPFRVGEWVALSGVEGQVESIELFSTRLLHLDRSQVVIPNRKIVGEILHNYGRVRQLELTLRIAYGADITKALATVHELLASSPQVLKELAPLVGVSEVADGSLCITIQPWVGLGDYLRSPVDLNLALIEAFRRAGIELFVPLQQIRLLNPAP
jgi:small conductance mechanosensitive channel